MGHCLLKGWAALDLHCPFSFLFCPNAENCPKFCYQIFWKTSYPYFDVMFIYNVSISIQYFGTAFLRYKFTRSRILIITSFPRNLKLVFLGNQIFFEEPWCFFPLHCKLTALISAYPCAIMWPLSSSVLLLGWQKPSSIAGIMSHHNFWEQH